MSEDELAAQKASYVRGEKGMGTDKDEARYREELSAISIRQRGKLDVLHAMRNPIVAGDVSFAEAIAREYFGDTNPMGHAELVKIIEAKLEAIIHNVNQENTPHSS